MICPRCDDTRAEAIFESPVSGAWVLYRCPRCYFVWRSTEEEEVTRPELYEPKFKLDEQKIAAMDEKPPIPPLRKA
jgi:hypothetical protein